MPGLLRTEGRLAALMAPFALAAVWMVSPAESRRAIANSAILAGGTLAIALPLGAVLAVLLVRVELPGRRWAAASLGVLLFLPLYVQLSGWDAALGKLGWFSLAYGSLADPFLAGMRGSMFVHALAAAPWVALIVGLGLLQVDPAQEESALLVMPPGTVLWLVTLPQATPFLAAAMIWTVVSTTSEITVTNIFLMNPGERTYTEQFYMTFALTGEVRKAALAVLPGAVSLGAIVAATLWMVMQLGGRRPLVLRRPLLLSAGAWRPILAALLWLIVLSLLAVPIASLIAKAGFAVVQEGSVRVRTWSLAKCLTEIASAPFQYESGNGGIFGWRLKPEFLWTPLVAAAAASVALGVGLGLAWKARSGRWPAAGATAATVIGLAVPGPLVGAALIWLFNHDLPPQIPSRDGSPKSWLLVLYDETPLAPILAQAVRALPLAILICWHSFRTIAGEVLAAAALDGCTPGRLFWRIAVPQRQAAIAAAWLAAFAVAAGDLAWAHLVTPPGIDLLPRRVFGLVHSGVEEQVAAISLINVIAYSLLSVLILRAMRPERSRQSNE